MGFSEKTKKEVKEKAGYRCCICQNPFWVEAHHIIPIEHGGTDEIDNAAPLCPNCHEYFGDSVKKRKGIKERRDWWYKEWEKQRPNNVAVDPEWQEKIGVMLSQFEEGNIDRFDQFKTEIKGYIANVLDNLTPSGSTQFATGVVKSSTEALSSIESQDVGSIPPIISLPKCKMCGKQTWVLVEGKCTTCAAMFP